METTTQERKMTRKAKTFATASQAVRSFEYYAKKAREAEAQAKREAGK